MKISPSPFEERTTLQLAIVAAKLDGYKNPDLIISSQKGNEILINSHYHKEKVHHHFRMIAPSHFSESIVTRKAMHTCSTSIAQDTVQTNEPLQADYIRSLQCRAPQSESAAAKVSAHA